MFTLLYMKTVITKKFFFRFNLKVLYQPPYKHEVWHYSKANVDHIRKVTSNFQWKKSFAYMDVNEMVYFFIKIIKNIVSENSTKDYYYMRWQGFIMVL